MLTQKKFLTDEEIKKLLETLKRHRGTRDSLVMSLALFSGARSAEVLQVRKQDLMQGSVFIRAVKGSNDRLIPLPPWVYEDLSTFAQDLPNDSPLFPISTRHFRRIWHWYRPCKKGLHALRHTFGVRAYNNCEDLHAVKGLLGHKAYQSTLVYLNYVQSQRTLRKKVKGMWDKKLDAA